MARKDRIAAAARTGQRSDRNPSRQTGTSAIQYPGFRGQAAFSPGQVAEPDNLVLEHLKKIQAQLSAARERDREIISRLGILEISSAILRRELGHCEESIAAINVRMDRMSDRIEHIERRLELTDTSNPA